VVVTRAHPVEHGRRDLKPEGLADLLDHADPPVELGSGTPDHDVEARRVDQLLVFDDIAGLLAVQGDQLVADLEPGRSRW